MKTNAQTTFKNKGFTPEQLQHFAKKTLIKNIQIYICTTRKNVLATLAVWFSGYTNIYVLTKNVGNEIYICAFWRTNVYST